MCTSTAVFTSFHQGIHSQEWPNECDTVSIGAANSKDEKRTAYSEEEFSVPSLYSEMVKRHRAQDVTAQDDIISMLHRSSAGLAGLSVGNTGVALTVLGCDYC